METKQLKLIPTVDTHIIEKILNHPDVYKDSIDDFSPNYLEIKTIPYNHLWISVYNADILCGGFLLVWHNTIMCEVHTCLFSSVHGKLAIKIGKLGIEWLFKNTQCLKIITNVPEYNKKALLFSKISGFKIEGINRKSIMKFGNLMDQTVLGLCKDELCQQQ